MLVSTTDLQQFNGSVAQNDNLQKIYINTAHSVINGFLGFDPEEDERWNEKIDQVTNPKYSAPFASAVKFVCLEIASLMEMEEQGNLGINNKSFSDSGSRTFLNVVNYQQYLHRLDIYRKVSV